MNAIPSTTMFPETGHASVGARCYRKAIAAGLAGGVVGTAIKTLTEALVPPRGPGVESPLGIAIRKITTHFTGHDMAQAAKHMTEMGVHWGFGILTGAVYAVVAERWPEATLGYGLLFGVCFWVGLHELFLPAVGWSPTPLQMTAWEQGNELISHCLYAVGIEVVRRTVRPRI